LSLICFSYDIFERDNADAFAFMSQHRQADGDLLHASTFPSLSNGLVFKAIDGFAIQSRSGEFDLRIVAAKHPDFACSGSLSTGDTVLE